MVPRVSVVIPVYNRAAVVGPTLDSALAQTYPSYEVVVVDDGSTDDLCSVLTRRYSQVRLLRLDQNSGLATALNRGIAAARGELIAFLDSDDLWSPDKLALQVEDFDAHPEAVLSFTDITYGRSGIGTLYSSLYPLAPHRIFEQLLEENPALPSAVLLRKRDLDRVGAIDPDMGTAYDRDLLLRLAKLGPFRFLPVPLVRRVVRRDAMSRCTSQLRVVFPRVVQKFLSRPEGEPYRSRERSLLLYQRFRIGARHVLSGDWRGGLPDILAAHLRNPLIAVSRPSGRRLLMAITGTAVHDLWPRVVRVLGKRRALATQRRVQRLGEILRLRRAARPYLPPSGVRFRPPPDAPD